MALILEKDIGFESADEEIKKGLETLFDRRFVNFTDLKEAMYKEDGSGKSLLLPNVYLSQGETIRADDLPFTITEWPIHYFEDYGAGGLSVVARVRVI
jgi:hypothetical protein